MLWIAALWKFLHTSSIQYGGLSDVQKHSYREGIKGLHFIVPCTKCKKHLQSFFNEIDIDLITSSEEMFKITYDLHKNINFEKELPSSPPLEEALASYKAFTFTGDSVKEMLKLTSFYIDVSVHENYINALSTYKHFLVSFQMLTEASIIDDLLETSFGDEETLLDCLRSNKVL